MPGNRKSQRNGLAIDGAEDTMGRLKVEDIDVNGGVGDDPDTYPDRPGEPDCIYFLRTSSCGFGINCRYNHPSNGGQVYDGKNTNELPERAGQPDCGYYLKTGSCKYGSACKYHHPKDKPTDVVVNSLGLPMRQDAKPCSYYMRTGSCKYGSVCKFHHPPPALTAGDALPVVGPDGSTVIPSSVSELSATSLHKTTYFAGSLQLPPSYMPLYVSPPQGWNTYMGSVGPLPVTSVLTSPSATNGQMPTSYLPERPDQPECRYFMNYGSCKYGSECKYHHPMEKVLALGSIGPLGLPIRPGQPVCSYYSFFGLCKYGPTCKFDHPLDGYSYAYNAQYDLRLPPVGPAYLTLGPYQRVPVCESKFSKSGDWVKKGSTTSKNSVKKKEDATTKDSPKRQESVTPSSEVVIKN